MPPRRHDDYTAAWICALPLELAAAYAMLDGRHGSLPLEWDSRDNNTYILGRVEGHNAVIACLPSGIIGTVSAARVVSQMLSTFRQVKFGLMIRIGGGALSEEHDVRLGNVVVRKPRVSQCHHINDTALGRRVLHEVSVAADGSWLYARLILDEIERLPSPAAVARHLQNIPNGLVQLYEKIFMTVEKALTPLELKLSQHVFIWLDINEFVTVGRPVLGREILDI
ncbi:hypothetical protein ETB97_008983, partial [Aspergillus alliaceus]